MRLLSFLSDIERALLAESPVVDGGAWETSRMVNFHHGLARLTLTPRAAADLPFPPGAIFVQAFSLADGSQCLKASLNWNGSESFPVISVYSTPNTNWKLEALKHTPWKIRGVCTQGEAIDQCVKTPPDVVIVSLSLPEESAFTLF
jgi:hypothetical protein